MFHMHTPIFDCKITYLLTYERLCEVSQVSMIAKELACRLWWGNTFNLKSQFCEPAILISANLRTNISELVHNICFSLTSIMTNFYQANCGKTLHCVFFNLTLWGYPLRLSLYHGVFAITILLSSHFAEIRLVTTTVLYS